MNVDTLLRRARVYRACFERAMALGFDLGCAHRNAQAQAFIAGYRYGKPRNTPITIEVIPQ